MGNTKEKVQRTITIDKGLDDFMRAHPEVSWSTEINSFLEGYIIIHKRFKQTKINTF